MPVKLSSTGGGSVTLDTPSTASNYTVTLPAANTTLADTSSTQTLTNKTIASLATTGTATFGGIIDTGSTGQIQFPATQNPSSNANTLDDYEEGTWTPLYSTVGGDYTGISYNTASGNYVKIGKQVTVQGQLVTNSAFSGGSGQTIIKGLPFTVANGATGVIWVSPDTANYGSPTALPTIGQCTGTTIPLSKSGTVNNPVFTELLKTGGNGNNLQFSLTYFTS